MKQVCLPDKHVALDLHLSFHPSELLLAGDLGAAEEGHGDDVRKELRGRFDEIRKV
jgi:hypothetical protein